MHGDDGDESGVVGCGESDSDDESDEGDNFGVSMNISEKSISERDGLKGRDDARGVTGMGECK